MTLGSLILWITFYTLSIEGSQVPFSRLSHSEDYEFKPLLHLPGISPYFDAVGSGLSHAPPVDCEVTAASYLIRHAAIYANDADYEKYIEPFLKKLGPSRRKHFKTKGPFSFLMKWESPIDDPESQLEEITPAGKKAAKKVGKHLLSRYPELVATTKHIYADKKSRTQDTAEALAAAFPQKVKVKVINTETSFHAQIPHKACPAFSKVPGDAELAQFINHYTPGVIERIQRYFPFDLSENDIVGMQQLCGYESAITGKASKFCPAFTDSEWMSYEYAWDIKYSFMVGHGNPLSPYLGFPWLNVTSALFSKFHAPHHSTSNGIENSLDDGQRFFLSFTHREVPPFIATALGLFNSSNSVAEEFTLDNINWSRSWRMAELIPFLGHIGIEKVTCGYGSGLKEYVRILANSAPRPIPTCQSGPGASCPFDQFTKLVHDGITQYADFHGVCGNSTKY